MRFPTSPPSPTLESRREPPVLDPRSCADQPLPRALPRTPQASALALAALPTKHLHKK